MSKNKKAAVSRVFEVRFSEIAIMRHLTMTALNAPKDKLYVTDSSLYLPSVFVSRLTLDGTVDTEFGGIEGWRAEDFQDIGSAPFNPAGLLPRSSTSDLDGGVIAGLYVDDALGLVSFNADGTLDSDFGEAGKVVHRLFERIEIDDDAAEEFAEKYGRRRTADGERLTVDGSMGVLAAGEDGKFYGLIGGRFSKSGALMRMLPSGKLDEAFGRGGVVTIKYEDKGTGPVSVVSAGREGVVVVGTIGNRGTGFELFLVRYSLNGELDEGFGTGGYVLVDYRAIGLPGTPFQMEFNHVVRHQDGGYFAAGSVMGGGTSGLVVRVDNKGHFVGDFNSGKPLLFQVPAPDAPGEYLNTDFLFGGLSVQSDGKLIVSGGVEERSSGYARDALVARFTQEGIPDTSFTPTGWLTFRPAIGSEEEAKVSYMQNLIIGATNETIYAAGDAGPDDDVIEQLGFVAEIK